MDLKQELTDYEIGGIGDIKKHTLRFRSYRIGTEGGKLMIYAEYEAGWKTSICTIYMEAMWITVKLADMIRIRSGM